MTDSKIAFLFDLDGVIIDSERTYTRIWQAIDEAFPTGVKDFARVIKGTTLYDILERYFPAEVRPEVRQRCLDAEQHIKFGYEKGAFELLSHLKEQGYPTALVTSSDGVKMGRLWAQLPELRDMFTAIVDAEMVTRSKPDPQGYLKAAALLGVEASRCAVFEDAFTGVSAGRAAGAYVVGLTATLGAEKLAPASDLLLDSLEELDLDRLIATLSNR